MTPSVESNKHVVDKKLNYVCKIEVPKTLYGLLYDIKIANIHFLGVNPQFRVNTI